MHFVKKNGYGIGFTILGGVSGYLYWRFVGCESGACPIKSVWYYSVIFGAVAGYLIGDTIKEFISKRKNQSKRVS